MYKRNLFYMGEGENFFRWRIHRQGGRPTSKIFSHEIDIEFVENYIGSIEFYEVFNPVPS